MEKERARATAGVRAYASDYAAIRLLGCPRGRDLVVQRTLLGSF